METLLKNWRPICLLCNDYKIFAKLIANRLALVINEIVGKQQTGFIAGRSIYTNILKTTEIVAFLNRKKLPGVIAMIDFEKCFDRVHYQSIQDVFKYFGFGQYYRDLIASLYSNFQFCTSNNGFLSQFMVKGRGTNQGCPASPQIYAVCGEVMNHLIERNNTIRGIPIPNLKDILSQFADDTAAFLMYDQTTVEGFINVLASVEEQMGLKVSYDKTTLYRVGSLYNTDAKLYTSKDFVWSSNPIETLGVSIPCNGDTCNKNVTKIMGKIKNTCKSWFNRQLSLSGRILVVNTLMASICTYQMVAMVQLKKTEIDEIVKIMREYVWVGKKPKISWYTLTKKFEQGGLQLIDLVSKQKALAVSWIFKLPQTETFIQESVYTNLCPVLRESIWRCNLKSKEVNKCFLPSIWRNILQAWCELNYKEPENKTHVLDQVLWYNSNIKVGNKPFVWKGWVSKNIILVRDIVDGTGRFLRGEQLGVGWIELQSLIHAIPKTWKTYLEQGSEGEAHHELYVQFRDLKSNVSRKTYHLFIHDEEHTRKYLERWEEKGILFNANEFDKAFVKYRKCTKVVKFRDLQYRLLLNKVITKVDLKEWTIEIDDECQLCELYPETTLHVFTKCAKTQPLREYLYKLAETNGLEIDKSNEAFILNSIQKNDNHVINFIALVVKHYMYRCKCQGDKPSVKLLKTLIQQQLQIEWCTAKLNNNVKKCKQKWSPICS